MERLTPLLGSDCKKIFHATTSHWKFNNEAEAKRFDDLYARRGVRLHPDRIMPSNRALELCDEVTLLGNDATASTYAHGGKPITQIPVSTTHEFQSPSNKDFAAARKNFIWFGGAGVIHKGLDLVVEAFAQMPDYTLTICGKLDGETDFKKVYEYELSLPNIHIAGFMDPGSKEFKKLCDESLALVYPSCAEGQAGSVVLAMHAGLIPLISRESGVDIEDFGVILTESTPVHIESGVVSIASLPTEELRQKALGAHTFAREYHTRTKFNTAWGAYIDRLLSVHSVS
jgi:glycosyltransferase involved in cell wall biosynthesis